VVEKKKLLLDCVTIILLFDLVVMMLIKACCCAGMVLHRQWRVLYRRVDGRGIALGGGCDVALSK
jgi:hypothetical protein